MVQVEKLEAPDTAVLGHRPRETHTVLLRGVRLRMWNFIYIYHFIPLHLTVLLSLPFPFGQQDVHYRNLVSNCFGIDNMTRKYTCSVTANCSTCPIITAEPR